MAATKTTTTKKRGLVISCLKKREILSLIHYITCRIISNRFFLSLETLSLSRRAAALLETCQDVSLLLSVFPFYVVIVCSLTVALLLLLLLRVGT